MVHQRNETMYCILLLLGFSNILVKRTAYINEINGQEFYL